MPEEPKPAGPFHIGEDEDAPNDPPFVGPLAFKSQIDVLAAAEEWRSQGVVLDHSIIMLRASGPGLPEGMESSGVCTGADGTVGATMEVPDLLDALVEMISLTCEKTELRDPFKELDAFKAALFAFIREVAEAKERNEPKTLWQHIRWRFPSRHREKALVRAFNNYMKIVTHIQEHGFAETPDEDVAGMEDLTPEDFQAK